MTNPICQLMEDIEGLCKRCYHLQKSNNDMYGKDEERETVSRSTAMHIQLNFRLYQRRSTITRIHR